jgi:hypothetical protein
MKLCVLALDYDGTIAQNDRPDSSVIDAIAGARRRGVKVLLVTGRMLDELRRVAGELRFVDAVVAENGAVVHFPDSGHTTILAQPVHPALGARLSELGIKFQQGTCLIDADASSRASTFARDMTTSWTRSSTPSDPGMTWPNRTRIPSPQGPGSGNSVVQPFAVLARQDLDLLFVQDDAIQVRIARLERPIGLTIFLEHAVKEPCLPVAVIQDLDGAKHDHARIHERRVARERLASVHRSHVSDLHTHSGMRLDVSPKVAAMTPCVHVHLIAAFVYIDQRNHVGPPGRINGRCVCHLLPAKERTRVVVWHEARHPMHPPSRVLR